MRSHKFIGITQQNDEISSSRVQLSGSGREVDNETAPKMGALRTLLSVLFSGEVNKRRHGILFPFSQ